MNQWISESMNHWFYTKMVPNPPTLEAVERVGNPLCNQYTNEAMNQWSYEAIKEAMNQWVPESMKPSMKQWSNESMRPFWHQHGFKATPLAPTFALKLSLLYQNGLWSHTATSQRHQLSQVGSLRLGAKASRYLSFSAREAEGCHKLVIPWFDLVPVRPSQRP